ncbi:MAG: pyridoxal phosphate-dependent aminotransferase [Clostridia bacterium]|nr:pyridoxal phosphate-dependent aminotransferase [Clostridia bacterium]
MLVKYYSDMLSKKSAIRNLFDFGRSRAEEIGKDNVFDFSIGNPSVPVPDSFNESLKKFADYKDGTLVHGYSPTLGIHSVKEAIAASLNRRFGEDYTADHIFMTTGAAGALAHALRAVCEAGSSVMVFAPFFPEYVPYITGAGCIPKIVPPRMEDFQIDFEKFSEMLDESVSAVMINSPNNPSGVMYSEDTIKKLCAILSDAEKKFSHPIYLISDEPYREILFGGIRYPYVSKLYDDTIVCYSFSKSLSIPGERIGYVAVDPRAKDAELLVPVMGQISRFTGHNCPPSIIQLAVAENLEVTSDMSVYEGNAEILYEELTRLGFRCVRPDGTFYMFPEAPGGNSEELSERAKKHDLLLVPGTTFGCPGNFRISYCVETEKVIRSLESFRKLAKEIF